MTRPRRSAEAPMSGWSSISTVSRSVSIRSAVAERRVVDPGSSGFAAFKGDMRLAGGRQSEPRLLTPHRWFERSLNERGEIHRPCARLHSVGAIACHARREPAVLGAAYPEGATR